MEQLLRRSQSDQMRKHKLEVMRTKYAKLTQVERQQHIQSTTENRKKRKFAQISSNGENTDKSAGSTQFKKSKYARLTNEQRRSYIENVKNLRKQTPVGQRRKRKQLKDKWLLKAQMAASNTEVDDESYNSELHELKKIQNCAHCNAIKFDYEPPTFCCDNGKIKLAPVQIPQELLELFTSTTKESELFLESVRAYNGMFSFASFGVKLDKNLASGRSGVYTFRVQGQVYHDLPGLMPDENGPIFFQLYFHDIENEVKNRMKTMGDADLNETIAKKLMKIVDSNPYSKFFKSLRQFPSLDNIKIHLAKNANLDQRVYNCPTTDQVAAIWMEGNNANIPFERDIVLHSHSGQRHRIKHYFGCYDSLQYPLLFPNGDIGWHQNIHKVDPTKCRIPVEQNKENVSTFTSAQSVLAAETQDAEKEDSKKVSCREYYSYKLQMRPASQCILLFARRLFQQFTVDMYVKLETTRLDFYRRKQNEMRAELYQGIVDSVMAGETRASEIGQRVVLPASFVGGPRDMRRRYLDAMGLVQQFGKPDLFITMTCNPEWTEIKEHLKRKQRPQDRPDLTSRVFRAKLQDLKDQLFKKEIFGKVAAHVYVIEFQKRGLPHAHMLIILKSEYKLTTPDQFDRFVCAELPDRNKNPILYDLVIKHMMHGPCGKKNKKNSCMVNGECKFHYPRAFCEKTVQGKDGYPIYRRRNSNRIVILRKAELDNRWVVPYNPYLLLRYNCHINVEICSGVQAVKYLYKYIYKGHDKVSVYIAHNDGQTVVDEIQNFQDARWVSAQEAIWRIYGFHLNEIYPAVINLQLHLPNKQFVTYWKNQNLTNVVCWDHISKTMLTEYFDMCRKSKEARKYFYSDFPQHYVWDKKERCWNKRKQGEVIGRINGANPNEGERYYLRLLLNHVKGPKSFEDLLMGNGFRCSSFKEAAQKRGLLESDQSIQECLDEAVTFQMPHALRRLFATILVYCQPANVRKLWDIYFPAMSEDFRRHVGSTVELETSKTLESVNLFLESMGKSIKLYDLPTIVASSNEENTSPREIRDEISIHISENDYSTEHNLNNEQEYAFLKILDRVDSGNGGVFFIDGPGGTGKTYLYRALLTHLRSKGLIAIATATSGVAAAIMPGGRTAHSRFKIPINANETSMCTISKQSGLAELLRKASLIIWDEAPMAKRWAIETLDRSLMDIMNDKTPFGRKVIVFGGDFRQVLPVVPKATIQQTIEASLVKSYLWPKMEKFILTANMRARADPYFSEFLLRVGDGEEPTDNEGNIQIPEDMIVKYDTQESSVKCLIDTIFPSLMENANSTSYITSRAILATRNECVDKINEKMISLFPGKAKTYTSFDEAIDDTQNYYQEEFLNSLTPNGLPPHKLALKHNCPIILLRNLDPSDGMCNGTRLVCRELKKNVIRAEIAIGQYAGKEVLIPRIPLCPAENEGYPFQFRRKQFPIRLCFAMTINKAQGQTIPNVGVYLPQSVFSHGQLYVALSRGISSSTTKILIIPNASSVREDRWTKNIVYKQVLIAGTKSTEEKSKS